MQRYFRGTHYVFITLAVIAGSCARNDSGTPAVTENSNVITLRVEERQQTIHNFGGSDAWSCQFVGQWPDNKRNQVADWLFSMETASDGKPTGIGLSLWRFNIGAGSAAQDNIADAWRRAEGFLKQDKTYDWSRQAGQQWFLRAAKQRGLDQFLAFTNSPPVQFTKNGKAFSSDGENANIASGRYSEYARFLTTVLKHFRDEGIAFRYISPFNEPQWDWTGNNQEGTPYTNQEIFDITRKLDSVITAEGLPTKIQVAEAGKMNYLYENADKPGRGNQVEDFFVEGSAHYLGALPAVDKVISAHSYFTSAPMNNMIAVRKAVAEKIKTAAVPLEFWQSEYCVLGDQEEIPGAGKDKSITTALYVARLIHHDLTVANASAWHWWTSLSAYDYKDGLIYVEKKETNGLVEDTKLLWALGNYSRFIRPGAIRIGVTSQGVDIDSVTGLLVSAYIHDQEGKLVVVAINYSANDIATRFAVPGHTETSFIPYITSGKEGDDLRPLPAAERDALVTIPAKSIVTFVSDIK